MGFKLSRLAQAMLATALYSTAVLAADKTDDFYIEIKGPDSHVQPQLSTAPVAPVASKKISNGRTPHPYIPERLDKTVLTTNSKIYGPVKKTDTTWAIANAIRKLYPGQGISTRRVMVALHRKNPHAFASGQLDTLLAGTRLSIPSLSEIQATVIRPATQQAATKADTVEKKNALPVDKSPSVATSTPTNSQQSPSPATVASNAVPTVALSEAAKTTIVASTSSALIDSKVSELVAGTAQQPVVSSAVSTATATAPQAESEELLAFKTENKELKDQIQKLNAQLTNLQSTVQEKDQLKQELATLQTQLQEHEKAAQVAQQEKKQAALSAPTPVKGFLAEILATPLNLLLLISLPVLAILVVLSFWLRSRAKRELAAREQEMAESTAVMMDETESDFGDLLAVDLSENNDNDVAFPDLNLQDESLIPTSISAEVESNMSQMADDVPLPPDVVPEISEDIFSAAEKPDIDLNARDENPSMEASGVEKQDFAAILSDADLAQALEADFSFSAVEPEVKTEIPEPTDSFDFDLTTVEQEDDTALASRLNLDKMMADPGLQMTEQVVSEPEGWELSADEQPTDVLTASTEPDVDLKAVHDDTEKSWLKQFEADKTADMSNDYLSIDELLAQTEKMNANEATNPDSLQPNLDIGLDEFPDMLPQHDGIDIDDDGGMGAKLDLARAYLEIDDKESAKELLLEVQETGTREQIKEAEKLLSRLA
ncbi:FimV/HubP family polar landmark protein [Tolumonas lignilytica]|uniref:FimV/HubP family polar landmark protein n=1 Tax=Tolumonas lignilytica TaxID=1283284 RepID=UPI000466202A|nr:FimV/HubP family polar landmark protein [Tolumonas lignilytica]